MKSERNVAEPLPKTGFSPGKTTVAQARLILQDPTAFDQASQPALRSSMELVIEPASSMEREKARELWESMSLEPEVAQERQTERKRLLARADTLARESAAAQAEALALQAQLAKARDDRLKHPVVYAGVLGIFGLGALWLLERRKRMQLQERELEIQAQQTPELMSEEPQSYLHEPDAAFSIEDSPDLATDFATDLPGLPESKQPAKATAPVAPGVIQQPESPVTTSPLPVAAQALPPPWAQPHKKASTSLPTEEELVALSWQAQDRSLLAVSKRVLGNLLRRRSKKEAVASSHLSTQAAHLSSISAVDQSTLLHADSADDATQMLYDEEAQQAFEQELLAQQLHAGQTLAYDPDQANIDLLSQMRITPQRGESAMEHLLELRTAVNGLCVLGRPEGAARLLEDHVAADPSTCAWAYLEYMNLCEQMSLRDDFESMRKRYRQQFSRMAPYWHEPNSNVLGLDGYSRAASELCSAWAQGSTHAYSTLSSWLAGPLLGRKLVQLPAYHDLFDLYEMLEFMDIQDAAEAANSASSLLRSSTLHAAGQGINASHMFNEAEQDFVPTVSLLDLDYEFSSDVTLEERDVEQAEKAVTAVKTGNFSVDFNVAGTQLGSLPSMPAELDKK